MNHRASYRSSIVRREAVSRKAKRCGLLTTVCLAALTVAVPAGAAPSLSHISRDVAVVANRAYTHANRAHPDRYQDTFAIHELGSVVGAGVDNRATAVSAGCSPLRPCRSVALSFQIVTMAGADVHLNATNLGHAVNDHCTGCQTLAGAYQFIVSTPQPFSLSTRAKGQLDAIHRQLDDLRASQEPTSVIHDRADALAAEVLAVLNREAAAAPRGPAVSPRSSSEPVVTMHRHFDQLR
ncbi:hypothetical protein GCM10010193_32130 [Kitasatospora atroaurantiaca]|uniref:Uncharacterized protein n=1 Tax=Kitasatospora atroaurantiaca TaxID=285545 RepID=A0A561ERF9_9ACTN|nr:hypothetical protein [Kitasatospora atroaurantiaca]TWE18198.1 hypothetical protein FB465_3248 [Kitasatospora atroaurantiaca]